MNKLIAVLFVTFSFNAYAIDGMNSLLIGHSFFRPYAELLPDYSAAAGIAGHTQTIVFNRTAEYYCPPDYVITLCGLAFTMRMNS